MSIQQPVPKISLDELRLEIKKEYTTALEFGAQGISFRARKPM